MPTSRLPKPNIKAPAVAARRLYVGLFIVCLVLLAIAVMIIALPASLIQKFLPPGVAAEEFSGTLWHGSAGRVTLDARSAGAVEWHLHPSPLLHRTLSVDLHCVTGGFVADTAVEVDARGLSLHDAQGGGPIEDLQGLGISNGWRGTTRFKFTELKAMFANDSGGAVRSAGGPGAVTLTSAVGDIEVSNLVLAQVADGTDLGGYLLHVADGAITPDSDATAQLTDTGGPVEVAAVIHMSGNSRTGMLSGTVKERPDAPPALRREVEMLTQMHARDAQGRIPVELEFTL